MSFEGNKKRLVDELAEAQAQVRAQYGMPERDRSLGKDAPKPGTGKRISLTPR